MLAHLATQYLSTITFFNCYLATPWPTMDHYWGDSLANPMLITAFFTFSTRSHRKPCNEVGSLNSAEHQVGFEPV